MATKHTCYCIQNAEDDEPLFTLLARDGAAPGLVRAWAATAPQTGQSPGRIEDALRVADEMDAWRKERRPHKIVPTSEPPGEHNDAPAGLRERLDGTLRQVADRPHFEEQGYSAQAQLDYVRRVVDDALTILADWPEPAPPLSLAEAVAILNEKRYGNATDWQVVTPDEVRNLYPKPYVHTYGQDRDFSAFEAIAIATVLLAKGPADGE